MIYMQGRFQLPAWGRFASPDPAMDQHLEQSQSWNLYSYVQNNPVMLTDPTGMEIPWGFAMRHPVISYRVGEVKDGGRSNISSRASNFAINLGLSDKPGSGMGGDRNAVRHTIWQAIITKELGAGTAQKVGDAHEENPNANTGMSQETRQVMTGTLKGADDVADLMNNEIGRKIGSENQSGSNTDLAGKVLEEFSKNGLWEAQPKDGGGYTVSKTKMDDESYSAARKKLDELDNDGKKKR